MAGGNHLPEAVKNIGLEHFDFSFQRIADSVGFPNPLMHKSQRLVRRELHGRQYPVGQTDQAEDSAELAAVCDSHGRDSLRQRSDAGMHTGTDKEVAFADKGLYLSLVEIPLGHKHSVREIRWNLITDLQADGPVILDTAHYRDGMRNE